MKYLLIMVMLLSTAGCGGSSSGDQQTTAGSAGSIKAIVSNSKSFNPNISQGKIIKYQVTITGEGIEEPIIAQFDGNSEGGTIEGVPAGKDRAVKVGALNQNEKVVRSGESFNLEVAGGEVTDANVQMESVPVFTNLNDGNVIPNTRFIAKIFSEPGDSVIIEDEYNGVSLPVMDLSTSRTEVEPDVSTGLANIIPGLLPVGEHRLTAKNLKNNRSSVVTVRLINGKEAKPAPFFSAGSVQPVRVGGIGN